LEDLRRKGHQLIVVDSGDLFSHPSTIDKPLDAREKEILDWKVDLYLKTYDLMGYDALTPGEIDLSWGVRKLVRKSKEARFFFLLANLIDGQTQKPVFRPYMIKEVGGMKIGFLGLLSKQLVLGGPPEEKGRFYLADPILTAKKAIDELKRNNCEIFIALAHMEKEEQITLAQAVPEIQFIISGHDQEFSDVPIKPDKSGAQIFFSGIGGEFLGQVDFSPFQRKWQSRFQTVKLKKSFPEHFEVEESINHYKEVVKSLFLATVAEVQKKVPELRDTHAPPPFVGEKGCLPCHPQQHQFWQITGHALAYQTLDKRDKSSDFTCLPCHTTNLKAGGALGGLLESVQCEACHGARKAHVEKLERGSPVDEKRCLICHNPAKSPNYRYLEYLERIRCPKSDPAVTP
jgi:predicted CXXCH cytochrome family protein